MSEHTTARSTSTTPGTGYGRVSTETMKSIVETSKKRRTFWQQLGLIGPAFVAGAWQFGPGNLTTAVQAGSGYQYTLIWVIVVSTILMIFLTDMSVRLGIKSPVSLIASIKDHLGKCGRRPRRHRRLPHHPLLLGRQRRRIRSRPLDAVRRQPRSCGPSSARSPSPTLLLLRNVYRVVEKVLVGIVALMAIAFVASAFIANPDWAAAGVGTASHRARRLLAADRRPRRHELLHQRRLLHVLRHQGAPPHRSGLPRRHHRRHDPRHHRARHHDRARHRRRGGRARQDRRSRDRPSSPSRASSNRSPDRSAIDDLRARVLRRRVLVDDRRTRPPAARCSPTASAAEPSSSSLTAKVVSGSILAFGIIVTLIFQASPVQLIVIAQALTVFVAPVLAALILIMANRKSLMGGMRNKWWQNVAGIIGLASRPRPVDPAACHPDQRIDTTDTSAAGTYQCRPRSCLRRKGSRLRRSDLGRSGGQRLPPGGRATHRRFSTCSLTTSTERGRQHEPKRASGQSWWPPQVHTSVHTCGAHKASEPPVGERLHTSTSAESRGSTCRAHPESF